MALPTRFVAVGAAVAATGLVAGGVFAASIANFSASTLAVGETPLSACFDNQDTTISVNAGTPVWDQNANAMVVNAASVSIIDTVNQSSLVQCNGKTVKVVAVDTGNAELGSGTAVIGANGDVTNLAVTLTPTVDAADINDWAIAIY